MSFYIARYLVSMQYTVFIIRRIAMIVLMFLAIWMLLTGANLERKSLINQNPVYARHMFMLSGLCFYMCVLAMILALMLAEQSALHFFNTVSGFVILLSLTVLEWQRKYVQVHLHLKAAMIILLILFVANFIFLK
jgi:hypothetical protein